jgi:aminoglycoside/choline kinase family phosphotransferase
VVDQDDLTPDLLTALLADHTGGATVESVRAQAVGTGQMAVCLRLELGYRCPGAGPSTVVAKLPSRDPASRGTAGALRAYEIEVNFYRQLHGQLDVRAPKVYHSALDVESTDFLLLMEDVAPARQGDQLAGCTVEQAAGAVGELVGLHAPLWGHGRLAGLEWLHRYTDRSKGSLSLLVGSLYPGFVDRYADRLDPAVRAVSEQLVAGLNEYEAQRPGPWTVTHGDFRLDNLLFSEVDPGARVCVVDWQTAVLGPGVTDLSYFIGGAFDTDHRRLHEEHLVGLYHERLAEAGVGLAWEDLRTQYRRYALGGLIMAIAASMLVERTPRGDDMFMTMAQRHGQHAIDLDATALLRA